MVQPRRGEKIIRRPRLEPRKHYHRHSMPEAALPAAISMPVGLTALAMERVSA